MDRPERISDTINGPAAHPSTTYVVRTPTHQGSHPVLCSILVHHAQPQIGKCMS
jgi:hypothetical protein